MRLFWTVITAVTISLVAWSCRDLPEETGAEADSMDQDMAFTGTWGGGTPKVTICHVPPGNPANAHTITVGASAVPAHLRHGDTIGYCHTHDGGHGDGDHDGGCGGGGDDDGGVGECGMVGDLCTQSMPCCAGLTCVDDSGNQCSGEACTCQMIIN